VEQATALLKQREFELTNACAASGPNTPEKADVHAESSAAVAHAASLEAQLHHAKQELGELRRQLQDASTSTELLVTVDSIHHGVTQRPGVTEDDRLSQELRKV
jgi:hypothetical protein